jgi:hypothetical protein
MQSLIITLVGIGLDLGLLWPIICFLIATFKTCISWKMTREQIKQDMGMIKTSDLGKSFNWVIS